MDSLRRHGVPRVVLICHEDDRIGSEDLATRFARMQHGVGSSPGN